MAASKRMAWVLLKVTDSGISPAVVRRNCSRSRTRFGSSTLAPQKIKAKLQAGYIPAFSSLGRLGKPSPRFPFR